MKSVSTCSNAAVVSLTMAFRFEPISPNETLVHIVPGDPRLGPSADTGGLPQGLRALRGISGLVLECSRLKSIPEELLMEFFALNFERSAEAPLALVGLNEAAKSYLALKRVSSLFRIAGSVDELGDRNLNADAIGRCLDIKQSFRAKIAELIREEAESKVRYHCPTPLSEVMAARNLNEITLLSRDRLHGSENNTLHILIDRLPEEADYEFRLRSEFAKVPTDRPLEVDLGGVRFLGATAIGQLMALRKRFDEAQQSFRITEASGAVKETLMRHRLYERLANAA